MAGFKNHEVNGPGEARRSWGVTALLKLIDDAGTKRGEALADARGLTGEAREKAVQAARGWHWIRISGLIALGVCTVAQL